MGDLSRQYGVGTQCGKCAKCAEQLVCEALADGGKCCNRLKAAA